MPGLLFDALKAKSPPLQREAFRVTRVAPDNSAVKLVATLSREAPKGQVRKRPGGWRRKEDGKDLRQARRWFSRTEYRSEVGPEWGPVRITPDLRAVAVQATESRPALVPPSSLERVLLSDTRLRCELKAEYRAKGYEVDTAAQVLEAMEIEREERRQLEEVKARASGCLGGASLEQEVTPPKTLPGSLGFTDKHRRGVKRACGVLAEYRGRVAMFTATLSPLAAEALAWVPNGWGELLRVFRRRLSRYLRSRGIPLLAVDVTEIQLGRYKQSGVPVPHLHLAFVGRNDAKSTTPWALSKEQVREMWNRSVAQVAGLDAAAGYVGEVDNRTQIEGVEHDVFAYLSKYLSKGAEVTGLPWDRWVGLRPVRWWNQSKEMKAAVEARTIEAPGNFASWVETNENKLVEARLIRPVKRHCPEEIPVGEIITWTFTRVTAIRDCLRLYLRDVAQVRRVWVDRLEIVDDEPDPLPPPCLVIPSRDFEANEFTTVPVTHAGSFGDRLRQSIQAFERERQVSIPVLLPYIGFREEHATQLELPI